MKHLFLLIFSFWIIGSLNAQINQFSISPGGDKTLKKDSKLTIPAVASASYKWQKNPAWQKLPGSGDVGGFPANPNNMQDAVTSINGISYCINVDNDVWYYDSTYGAWGRLGNPTVDPNSIPLFGTIIPQYDNSRLATDNQGNLYVALENNSNGNYFVEVYRYDSTYIDENAIFPVNVWTKLGSHVGNTIDAEFFDLTISPDGIPYVLIVDVAQYIAKKFNGTDWELVGGNNLDGVFPSDIQTQSSSIFIEFDPSGKPYALAWDQASSAYRLASFNGTRWEQVGDTGCGIQTGYDVGNFVAGLYNEIFISTYKLDFFAAEGPIALIDIKRYSGANYSSLPNPLPTGYKGVYPFFVQDGSRFPYLTYSYLDESDTLGIATKRLFFDEPNDEIIWQDAFHANIDASDISPSIFFTKSFNFDRNGSPIIILSDFDSNLTPAIYRFKGEELNNNSNEFPVQDSGRYYAIVKKDNKTVWSLNNTNVTIEPCIPTSSDTTVTACGSYTWNGQTYTKSGTYTLTGTNAAGCDSTASLHLTITYKKADLSIGSVLQGGKIAYILQPGDIGYEANKIKGLVVGDPSVSKSWTRNGIEDFVNTSGDFAQGQSNTTNIVSLLGPGDYAAYYCDTLTYGGYTDWYLPSTYEVKLLFTNRVAAGLADQVHSTSTQSGLLFGLTTYRFRNLVAPDKSVIDSDLKTSSNIVRPVRNFSLDTCIITCVPTSSDTTISACSSFSWNGQTFTSSGIYKDTLTNVGGCDSIATLNLTITEKPRWYRDSDGDGYGTASKDTLSCTKPAGYVSNSRDCNDNNDKVAIKFWHKDKDRDGHGSKKDEDKFESCGKPFSINAVAEDYVENADDCNDDDPTIGNTVWYKDADSDGYGTGDSIYVCDQPTGYRLLKDMIAATGDCDDTNATIYPNSSTAATSILASSTSVTVGGSITLSVNGGSLGASDTWKWYTGSCGGTAIGSGTSIVVSPAVTTTYYLRAEGCTNTNCVSVTITACGPTGVTSNAANNTICSGTSTTLTVQGVLAGAASWKWYKNACGYDESRSGAEGAIGTGASLKVSPTSTTTYYVRSEGGICGKTICKSIMITVNPKPAKPVSMTVPAKICKQATIQLTVGAVNSATSYTWTVPAGWSIVSGQGTRTVVVKTGKVSADVKVAAVNSCGSSAVYIKRITLANCNATSSAVLVTSAIRPKAGEEVDTDAALNIQTYPNPSTNYFTVRNNNSFVIQLRMVQASGQVVEAFSQVQPGAAVEFGARYRPGIYLVEATGNRLRTTKKVIKH